MNAILAKLRELLILVRDTSISVDLRPESDEIQPMIGYYYQGVGHLRDALKAFLAAKELWRQLHEE